MPAKPGFMLRLMTFSPARGSAEQRIEAMKISGMLFNVRL